MVKSKILLNYSLHYYMIIGIMLKLELNILLKMLQNYGIK